MVPQGSPSIINNSQLSNRLSTKKKSQTLNRSTANQSMDMKQIIVNNSSIINSPKGFIGQEQQIPANIHTQTQ